MNAKKGLALSAVGLAVTLGLGLWAASGSVAPSFLAGLDPELTETQYNPGSVVRIYTVKVPFPELATTIRQAYPGWRATIQGSNILFGTTGYYDPPYIDVSPGRIGIPPRGADRTYSADWCIVSVCEKRDWRASMTMLCRGKKPSTNEQVFTGPVKDRVNFVDVTYSRGYMIKGRTALDMRAMPSWVQDLYRKQYGELNLADFEPWPPTGR